MTIQDALDYEIKSTWWAGIFPFDWMNNLSAHYFAWKTKRKWKRFQAFERWERHMILRGEQP